uniref:Uncharacterized protein n=1 Tax=Solibacter usitatus (strain Ellin6076) TaxID=234267 RepID=Q02AN3_SOLUE
MGSNESEISPPESEKAVLLTESLDQLLASKTFSRSGQLKRLLVYLRDATASTDPSVWSETSIGAIAFGRRDFNPKLDTIVRVEMRRLRQKLDEYYAGEGAASALRLRFERNTYRPYVEPHIPPVPEPPVEPSLPDPPPPPAVTGRSFRSGVVLGAVGMAAVLLAAGVLWQVFAPTEKASRQMAESPIWSGFRSTNVVVAVGTPLFFRYQEGFERNYHTNLPDDLQVAEKVLAHWPAFPLWNLWAPFDDIGAAVNLDRFLSSLNSTATIVSARQISYGGLAGKRTIVMGQPRGAPLLVDLLAEQNFRPGPHIAGQTFGGFVNAHAKPGELERYPGANGTLMMQSDESNPDYAVVTSIRLANGGEVLNVFGDRAQTGAYIIRKLTDPMIVMELNGRVFDRNRAHRSAQIVFRVDYSRGTPTGLVYVTHRVLYPDKKQQ